MTATPHTWLLPKIDRPLSITKVEAPIQFIPISDLYVCKKGIEKQMRDKKLSVKKKEKLKSILATIEVSIKLHNEL